MADSHDVTVKVFSPRDPDDLRIFTWPDTTKVGDAASEAARAMGYSGGTPTFEKEDEDVLRREKTLVGAGVKSGETLELVDAGTGV